MALLERVSTLLRANLNDLMDRAEDPAKMLKQLLLDMENQLLQVKTQVAIAVADQHLLEAKKKEHGDAVISWRSKAELALQHENEPLARAALERSLQCEQLLTGYAQQLEDQRLETDSLRDQYRRLQAKLEETSTQAELLLQQHRRNKKAVSIGTSSDPAKRLVTMRHVLQTENANHAARRVVETESIEDRFQSMERDSRVDQLLKELKQKPRMLQG